MSHYTQKCENERVATFDPEAFSSAAKPRSFSRYFSQCKFHYRRKITPFPRHRGHFNFQSSQLNKTLSSIEAALATAADRSGGVLLLPQKLRTKRGNGLRSQRTRTVASLAPQRAKSLTRSGADAYNNYYIRSCGGENALRGL